jgi:hypothetical protein
MLAPRNALARNRFRVCSFASRKDLDVQEFQMKRRIAVSAMALALTMGLTTSALAFGHGGGGHAGGFDGAHVGTFGGHVGGFGGMHCGRFDGVRGL